VTPPLRLGAALLLALSDPALSAQAPAGVAELHKAANGGDPKAQVALAERYRLGKGVKPDPQAAIGWYRKAADGGDAQASDELGFMLFTHGNRRDAIPYIEKAAARGDARALYLLGTAHFNGDYVPRNWPLAYAQTMRAAQGGLAAARKNQQLMERYLLAGDKAKAEQILATLPPVRTAAVKAETSRSAQVAPSPAASLAAASPAKGNWKAQIGAYGSPDRARAGWRTLMARVMRLGQLDQHVVPAGKVTRLQAWGLAGKSDADALCREIKRAGGDCFPIAP
jgi:uncharacterized protein